MERTVAARLDGQVRTEADAVLAVTVAAVEGIAVDETLSVTVDEAPVDLVEVIGDCGTRLHRCRLPVGAFAVDYSATVTGQADAQPTTDYDLIRYARPSRYCDSDRLAAVAAAEFGGLAGKPLLDAVAGWVNNQLSYVSGWSRPTDGAVDSYLARVGVCRDFAHLVITLLRASNVPARMAAVYAPGLAPMDFHAVAEAWVEGGWHVVDATSLAPRASMLRIATGRDAADTAFLTNSGVLDLQSVEVQAVVDRLPVDDLITLTRIS